MATVEEMRSRLSHHSTNNDSSSKHGRYILCVLYVPFNSLEQLISTLNTSDSANSLFCSVKL